MHDFICKKYEVENAPALIAPPAEDPAPAPFQEEPAVPEPDLPAQHQSAPDPEPANLPSLQASWLKAKRSTIRVPIVVNALEASVSKRGKHEDIKFSDMMEEARGNLRLSEKDQLTVGIAFISLLHLAKDQNLELIQGDDCGDFNVNLEKKGTEHKKEEISKVLSATRKKPISQSPSLPTVSEIPTATPSSKKAKTDVPKSAKTAGKTSEAPAPASKKLKVDQPTMTPDNPPAQKKASTPEKTKAAAEKPVSRKK
jgi:hypothetical protein